MVLSLSSTCTYILNFTPNPDLLCLGHTGKFLISGSFGLICLPKSPYEVQLQLVLLIYQCPKFQNLSRQYLTRT